MLSSAAATAFVQPCLPNRRVTLQDLDLPPDESNDSSFAGLASNPAKSSRLFLPTFRISTSIKRKTVPTIEQGTIRKSKLHIAFSRNVGVGTEVAPSPAKKFSRILTIDRKLMRLPARMRRVLPPTRYPSSTTAISSNCGGETSRIQKSQTLLLSSVPSLRQNKSSQNVSSYYASCVSRRNSKSSKDTVTATMRGLYSAAVPPDPRFLWRFNELYSINSNTGKVGAAGQREGSQRSVYLCRNRSLAYVLSGLFQKAGHGVCRRTQCAA